MNNSNSNVRDIRSGTPQGISGNGGGNHTSERLARLEERVNHLATSAQLQKTNTNIEKLRGEVGILKWMGGLIVLGIVPVIIKLFS